MNGERLKPHTDSLFVEGMRPTGFGREFGVDPQAVVDREMRHMIGTNQRGEREHRGLEGDKFAYHRFEHRMRKLKMPVFEGEDAYGWIYRVEWYFEILRNSATRTTTSNNFMYGRRGTNGIP
nr:ankyrin repeat-containing protein [Tanacetum cinerariifolium]